MADKTPIQATKTLTLRRPLMTADGEISALTLREPTAGELAIATRPDLGGRVKVVAAVSGVDEASLDKLGARDFLAAVDAIVHFA